jgi:hypothetical protein
MRQSAGNPLVKQYRDASVVHEQYDITMRDCVFAFHVARANNIFSLNTFNLNEYDYYASFDNGSHIFCLLCICL